MDETETKEILKKCSAYISGEFLPMFETET